jgi:hypothetical protein
MAKHGLPTRLCCYLKRRTDALCYLDVALGRQCVLCRLYPDAVIANAEDAACLGLNAACLGLNALSDESAHVVLPVEATHLAARLAERGSSPCSATSPNCANPEVAQVSHHGTTGKVIADHTPRGTLFSSRALTLWP